MKRGLRRIGWAGAVVCVAWCIVGCRPLQDGFQEGVSDGLAAALTALIETPIIWAIEQALNGGV